MKKSILYAAILFGGVAFHSCTGGKIKEADVPSVVVNSFKAKYPTATNTEWKKEKSDDKKVYEAAFKMEGKEIEAEFLEDGTFYKED